MSGLWDRDPDPQVAQLEDSFCDVGLRFIYSCHLDVHRVLHLPPVPASAVAEVYHTTALPPLSKSTPASRHNAWNRAESLFAEIRGYDTLKARQARKLARAITEKWYSEGLIETHARRRTIAAYLYGLMKAGREPGSSTSSLDAFAASIVTPAEEATLEYLSEHAAEHMTYLRDATRTLIADELLNSRREGLSASQVAVKLLERFGVLNRDWRRVAVTEISTARSHGFLSGCVGELVEFSAAAGCCEHCSSFDGKRFAVAAKPGNFETEVWVGKTNRGRSFHRVKRDGKVRSPEEMAGVTIPLHPNCRCRWIRVGRPVAVSERLTEAFQRMLSTI